MRKSKTDTTRYNREYAQRRRATPEGRDQNRNSSRSWRERNYKRVMLMTLRQRAKERGIKFSIIEADLQWPAVCPVFGIPLVYRGQGRGTKDAAASVDRLDSRKGYVPGNVFIVSWRANRIKNNATAQELRQIAKWIDSKGRGT